MQGGNRPITWRVGDYFQVIRSKTFENYLWFRFFPLLLGSAGLGGVEFAHLSALHLQPVPQAHILPQGGRAAELYPSAFWKH